jgi:hypothetical protein
MTSNQTQSFLQASNEWTNWFDKDLNTEINKILVALTPLIIGRPLSNTLAKEEPSGFDKISRKGNYENLLLSELAINEFMPEEFIRRACQNEHLFLQQGTNREKNSTQIIVLLDAGPHQLGSPRIAQIAIWLLLIQRAHKHKASFYWGILQSNDGLSIDTSERSIRNILKSRTYQPVNENLLSYWQEEITGNNLSNNEVWVATNYSCDKHKWIGCQLIINVEFGNEFLKIIRKIKNETRSARLRIPPTETATKLLTGKFLDITSSEVHQHIKYKISLQQMPLFSHDGKYVAVGLLEGGALVYRIPANPDEKLLPPNVQKWTMDQQLMAACLNGKKLSGLLSIDSNIHFWQVKRARLLQQTIENPWSFTHGRAHWNPMYVFYHNQQQYIYFLDSQSTLFLYFIPDANSKNKSTNLQICARNILKITQVNPTSLVLAYRPTPYSISIEMYVHGKHQKCYTIPNVLLKASVFFSGQDWRQGKGFFAIQSTSQIQSDNNLQHWKIFKGEGEFSKFKSHDLIFNSNIKVQGLIVLGQNKNQEPSLVAISASGKDILLISEDSTSQLFSLKSEIIRTNVNTISNRISIITNNRQLLIYDISNKKLILSSTTVEGHD